MKISSPAMGKDDFQYVPPKDAELKESLFGGLLGNKAPQPSAGKTQGQNNLKMLALAMLNYYDAYRRFPPTVLYGPDRKTPYSWRVALLPFLDQVDLYKQYRFDEPWDGPNNRNVLEKMPAVFRSPTGPDDANSKNASYYVLVGPTTIFDGGKGTRIEDIKDGTSNTILLVEAKRDVPWTKPGKISPMSLISRCRNWAVILRADSTSPWPMARYAFCPSSISEKTLRS